MQIRITTHEEWPVQVDGEPHIQPPGTITILKSALKAKMLKKAKKSRRNATSSSTNVAAAAAAVRPVRNEASPSSSRIHPCILLNIDSGPLMHEKSTSDEAHSATANGDDDDDEEGDAFL
ncbi:unnamed protein product [Brugia pahangi]|uniref:Uncharacterized protein n=1 Tax=Brugia pahangi TaxID=6280 RepID=A0A3P7QW62_BRUPA|nr:unnamed protein product [Brugia pahangi]